MASIRKVGKKWRAEIARKGVRKSRMFPSRQEAKDWAAREEFLITGGERVAATLPLSDLFDRYAKEVSPTKKGERWEVIRLAKLSRDPIARKRAADVTATDIASWRDRRLREVSAASVRREMTLIGAVFTVAVREWGYLRASPLAMVKKPPPAPARERLPTLDEIERLRACAGPLATFSGRVFAAFLFSIETAMRAGEICGLRWEHIDLTARVAHLPITKSGRARDVPLSTAARDILLSLEGNREVFNLSPRQLDANWRKLRTKAGIDGLTFHDARAEAATRLAQKLTPLELAKMMGHSDLSMLIRVYYRESASEIAKKLD